MRKLTVKLGIASLALMLTACASTNKEPETVVFDNYKVNANDSFAKNTMRLAGSNKFVDSTDGETETRQVTGSTAMKIGQLLLLDFAGAAQTSINENMIEGEVLSEHDHFIVKIDNVNSEALTNPIPIIRDALNKIKDAYLSAGFTFNGEKVVGRDTTIYLNDEIKCPTLTQVRRQCRLHFTKGHIGTYDKATQTAYVVFRTYTKFTALHVMSGYLNEDIRLFKTKQNTWGGLKDSTKIYSGAPAVLSNGKVNKFIKEANTENAEQITSLPVYLLQTRDREQKLYKYNISDMSFEELPLDAQL